jgi:hypothetical protein
MSGEWKMVFRGFAIAATGAAGLMLFIVALSAAYVAKFTVAAVSIVVAGCLLAAFRSRIEHYLNALDQREMELSVQLDSLHTDNPSRDRRNFPPTGSPSHPEF